MNGITISLIFLIVISMVLPTSAIMYASGQSTDNSDDSTTTTTITVAHLNWWWININ